MEITLSKNADTVLHLLYAKYLNNLKEQSESQSRKMGNLSDIQQLLQDKFHTDDVLVYCKELKKNKLLKAMQYDNTFYNIELTSTAIAYMESKSKDSLRQVFNDISGWSSAIASIVSRFI